jgi:hypothetical protein
MLHDTTINSYAELGIEVGEHHDGWRIGYCWRLVAPAPPCDWSEPYKTPSQAYRAAIDHLVLLEHQGGELIERAVGQ